MVEKLIIIYDEECPFCNNLIKLSNIRRAQPSCTLVNARDSESEYIEDVRHRYNLDEGMLVIFGGREFYGWSALHVLNKIEKNENVKSVSLYLFSSPFFSRVSYPILRVGRRIALFFLGIKKIGY